MTNDQGTTPPSERGPDAAETMPARDMPGLDASQRELYREGGETDTRSQELADEYEEGEAGVDRGVAGRRGQPVTGGQYGAESDANRSGPGQGQTDAPDSSSGGD